MGCSGSKVDDLPVVSLCRERTRFIEEAVQQRYLLSAAHLSYIRSLREVGAALEEFLDLDHVSPGASPMLTLPPHRKTDPPPLPKPKSPRASPLQSGGGGGSHGRSDSGHLQFDSDESLSDYHDHDHDHDHHLHSGSPPPPGMFQAPVMMDDYGGYPPPYTAMNQYFMRSRPPQPITYEERPQSPAKVNQYYMPSTSMQSVAYGGGSDSPEKVKHYFMQSTPMQSVAYEERLQSPDKVNQYFMRSRPMQSVAHEGRPQSPEVQWGQAYPYDSSNFGFPVFFGDASGTSSSLPLRPPPPAYSAPGASSSSYPYEQNMPPPPPPPPPKSSTWDFFNPFHSDEAFYHSYTPRRYSDGGSRDSREVREEEGIPELEEDNQSEVVKEIHGEKKLSDGFTGTPGWYYQRNVQFQQEESVLHDEDKKGGGDQSAYQGKPTAVSEYREDDGTEVVDKNVIENDDPVERSNAAEFPRSYDPIEAVKHIKAQFDKAAESGSQVSMILEVGRLPYRHKNGVHKASVRMLGAIAPPLTLSSRPSTSKNRTAQLPSSAEESSPALLDFEDITWLRTRKLSTTLEKLYMWEKKLFEEVKAEEKLRVIQERKRRHLQRMNEKGSEAHKVERSRMLIKNMSTKIRIAIHFVDSVSTKINKLRDEELFPQIVELLQGLVTMWKSMLECHQNQCRIVSEAKSIGFVDGAVLSDSHMRVTVRLELELLNWISSFYVWIDTQKGYIKALNSWLLKCLLHEPEITPDGEVPFSPGRIGAPPVFVVCNRWFQTIDGISVREVIEAMRTFSVLVHQQWQHHSAAQRTHLMSKYSPKDLERGMKALQKDEQKIQKAWDALYKKPVFLSVEGGVSSINQMIVQQNQAASLGGLKASLRQIFDAMAKFAETSLKAYEELALNTEINRITRERDKVS